MSANARQRLASSVAATPAPVPDVTIDLENNAYSLEDEADLLDLPEVRAISDIDAPIITQPPPVPSPLPNPNYGGSDVVAKDEPTNGWTQTIEVYVSSISIKCKDYRNIHEGSTIYYDKRNSYFTIFLIFVSFMVSSISLIPFFNGEAFKYVIATLSVFTTTLTTVNKFLKYQENSTKHRIASQKFLELHRNITEQFLLPFIDRTNGKKYVTLVGRSFDQIIKTAPYPPEAVKTRKKITSTPDTDIQLQSQFDTSANVIAVPNINPSTVGPESAGSIAPQGLLQIPQTTSHIQTVNPTTPNTGTAVSSGGGHQLSAMARWQLQRTRDDLDNYTGDYD